MPDTLPLTYRYQGPGKPGPQDPLVVLLHGYGSHENDLLNLVPALPEKRHYVSLRAPQALGFGGFAWYALAMEGGRIRTGDPAEARQALDQVHQFVKAFREQEGLTEAPLQLVGFSQGAILSYAYALHYPREVQQVAALSGYVLKDIVPSQYRPEDLRHLRFFVSHGTADEVIPIQAARQTVAFLEKLGVSHVYREYPEGHGIAPDNLRDLQNWFREIPA